MAWRLAPTLTQLLREINAAFPLRNKTSDGTLGNASHAASKSDHNPDDRGVVCAVDVDEDLDGSAADSYPFFNPGQPAKRRLVDLLIGLAKAGLLPQLYYVIYERKIYSRTNNFEPRAYSGANAHEHHVHVSVYHDARLADRKTPWLAKVLPSKPVNQSAADGSARARTVIDLSAVQHAMKKGLPLLVGKDGADLQRSLNRRMGTKLVEDGQLGPNTRRVYAAFQAQIGGGTPGDAWPNPGSHPDFDGIPGQESLRRLGFDVHA